MNTYGVSGVVYEFADGSTHLDDRTEAFLERYNHESSRRPDAYFERLSQTVETNYGPGFAFIRDQGDSNEEAYVIQEQWATSITPRLAHWDASVLVHDDNDPRKQQLLSEMPSKPDTNSWRALIEADWTHKLLKEYGITAQSGEPLAVIAISAPSLDRTKSGLAKAEENKHDAISAIALEDLRIVNRLGYGRIYAAGTSLGSVVAQNIVTDPGTSSKFDILGALFSESPNVTSKRLSSFALDYITNDRGLKLPKDGWNTQGPDLWKLLDRSGAGFDWSNVYKNGNFGWNLQRLIKAMRQEGLCGALESAYEQRVPVTVEYGTGSRVSKGTEELLKGNTSMPIIKSQLGNYLQVIRAEGESPHSHNLNIPYMGELAVRSVQFAQSVQ